MKSNLGLQIATLLLIFISGSLCFNLDVQNYIRHEGQDGSMFGFSVALHQEKQRSWWVSPASATSISPSGISASLILLNFEIFFLRWRHLETHFLKKRLAVYYWRKEKIVFEFIRREVGVRSGVMMSSEDILRVRRSPEMRYCEDEKP